jgi:GNAT superfamily N-acetyltransferase
VSRIDNLGFQSEFVISQLEAKLITRPEYTVLQTPSNPSYYFGNLLALNIPLNKYNKETWLEIFSSEFKNMPDVEHFTFTWVRGDADNSDTILEFTKAGYEFEEMHILALYKAEFKQTTQLNEQPLYRPLTSKTDWEQWIRLSLSENTGDHSETGLKHYLSIKAENYQDLEYAGLGEYLGAFVEDRLIGYAGLYHKDSLGRFQNVHVVPDYQNQKIASTLLTKLIQRVPNSIETLVIIADEHYHATQLYQSLGFSIAERESSLCWWPKSHRKVNQ